MGCDIHTMIEWKDRFGLWNNAGEADLYRDYELFAVLAGVRNDCGIVPIAEPRGVPEDACGEYEAWQEAYGGDGHSHSWVTLAELIAFNREQEIDDPHFVLSRDPKTKEITSTCKSTSGAHLGKVGKRKVFGVFGSDHFDNLIDELDAIKAKRKLTSDEDVRLCFFFDN